MGLGRRVWSWVFLGIPIAIDALLWSVGILELLAWIRGGSIWDLVIGIPVILLAALIALILLAIVALTRL